MRRLRYDWRGLYARPEQLAPEGDWLVWLFLAGRGAGKTRSMAEYCREYSDAHPGARIGIICPTYGVVRDVAIEGESGLLSILPPEDIDHYNRSLHQLTLKNGTRFFGYSGSDPERLRGPQHHLLWCEELAAWPYVQQTWDMAQFGLRLGPHPRTVISTTPRPVPILKELAAREGDDVVITRASTFANAANLPPAQLEALKRRYAGTYLGMQELQGLLIEDLTGALWTHELVERNRRMSLAEVPTMTRVVVGIDPAASSSSSADNTGIVVVGRGVDGHGYVLADRSLRASPDAWARAAEQARIDFKGDRIVAERNNGGEMVAHTLRTINPNTPVKTVFATRGKFTRAEPVAALYEQGRIHHVGNFPDLEDEMFSWIPNDPKMPSPDRVDALVWAITEVVLGGGAAEIVVASPAFAGTLPVF